ncbi:MAG: hypothetical protein HKP19_10240 [Xanthomonadales bacterium]|nr:hypothetical protein [Xanthomonadales bacterium]
MHVGYNVADIHRTFLLATLPALVIAAWTRLVDGGFAAFITAWSIMTVTVLAVSFFWHVFFARVRSRPLDSGWLMHGWLFAMMVPHDLPLSLAAVGISAGAVIGSLMFGGTGRYLVSPALVGVVLVSLSYPESFAAAESVSLWSRLGAADGPVGGNWWQAFLTQDSVATGSVSAAACLLGALLLSLTGAISWRIIAGALLGTALTAALFDLAGHGYVPVHWHWIVGVSPFYIAFVATDPTVAPVTRVGRWLYGALVGALIVIIRTAAPDHPEGTIAACLVASLFAPLIDRCCLPILLRPRKTVARP